MRRLPQANPSLLKMMAMVMAMAMVVLYMSTLKVKEHDIKSVHLNNHVAHIDDKYKAARE